MPLEKTVSVIIPTHNRHSMLKEAVESAIKQTDIQVEIIIIDDNSQDDTAEIQKEFPKVIYHRNATNLGPGENRRIGFNMSHGEFVVFMDDDDYYTDFSFYKKAIEQMDAHPKLAAVCANAYVYHVKDKTREKHPLNYSELVGGTDFLDNLSFKYRKPYSTFTTVFRKSSLLKAEFPTMKMMNDFPIYLRAMTVGDIYALTDFIGDYSVHGGNISNSVSCDFIIKNLAEKEHVLKTVYKKLKDPKKWWYWHYKMTYVYFYSTCPSSTEDRRLLRWGFNHINNSFILFLWLTYRLLRSFIAEPIRKGK